MSQRTRAALPLPAHAAAEHHVRAAASVVFNLEGYTVLQALDRPLGGRRVVVAADAAEGAGAEVGSLDRRHTNDGARFPPDSQRARQGRWKARK